MRYPPIPSATARQPHQQHAKSHRGDAGNTQDVLRDLQHVLGKAFGGVRKAAIDQPFEHQHQTESGDKIAHGQIIGLASPRPVASLRQPRP